MMKFTVAWMLLFMLLYVLSRTRSGHTIIYWTAWLAVTFLIVTHGNDIAAILSGVVKNGRT